ncbi:MAG TPA: hypothetical protein VJ656_04695 [Pyrinomonadaceae bacterium]|nr:hypothetical protein [Pyrinomonadaceae bacterium]
MFTSVTQPTEFQTDEQVPKSSPPPVWVGFLFAFAFFVVEVVFVIMTFDFSEEAASSTEDAQMALLLGLVGLPGMIYWMFCVHRLHKILAEMTRGRYPNTPLETALKHLIPFYNLYWIFKWPGEFSDYLNRRGRVNIISGAGLGVMLLLGLIIFRLLDGAIGMSCLFGVTMYMSSKLKAHVKALKGITPDQLPPLPDPRIFSRPVETSTSPAPETVESSQAG